MKLSFGFTCCVVLLFPLSSATAQFQTIEPSNSDAQVIRNLNAQAYLNFDERPLDKVCETISQVFDIQVLLDIRGLDEVGIGADQPVTIRAKGPLRQLISRMLYDIDSSLTWEVDDGLVVFTTHESAEGNLQIRVFDVSRIMHECDDFDGLIELITATVEPDSWDEVGGAGSVSEYATPSVQALVIATTYQIHCKIEDLLVRLHGLAHQTPPPSRRVRSVLRMSSTNTAADALSEISPRRNKELPKTTSAGIPSDLPMTRQRPIARRSTAPTSRRYVESPSWMDAVVRPSPKLENPDDPFSF